MTIHCWRRFIGCLGLHSVDCGRTEGNTDIPLTHLSGDSISCQESTRSILCCRVTYIFNKYLKITHLLETETGALKLMARSHVATPDQVFIFFSFSRALKQTTTTTTKLRASFVVRLFRTYIPSARCSASEDRLTGITNVTS